MDSKMKNETSSCSWNKPSRNFTNAEIASSWIKRMSIGKDLQVIFLGEIDNKYPTSKRLQLLKRIYCTLPHIVKGTPIP